MKEFVYIELLLFGAGRINSKAGLDIAHHPIVARQTKTKRGRVRSSRLDCRINVVLRSSISFVPDCRSAKLNITVFLQGNRSTCQDETETFTAGDCRAVY